MLEINGEKGSIRFNLERMNELEVFWEGEEPRETQGFHNVLVTEGYHPWWKTGGRTGTSSGGNIPSFTRSTTCLTA